MRAPQKLSLILHLLSIKMFVRHSKVNKFYEARFHEHLLC